MAFNSLTFRNKFTMAFMLISLMLIVMESNLASACSSRTISKPRSASSSILATPSPYTVAPSTAATITTPATTTTTTTTTTTPRPNITFPLYKCPANYDAYYCLNDATCFSIKLGDSVIYSCECAGGFIGPRCEYKEIDGSFQPQRPRPMLEKASIASGAICALLFMLILCLTLYLLYDQRSKFPSSSSSTTSFLPLGSYADREGEEEDDDICFKVNSKKACRYCSDKRCCGQVNVADLNKTEKYRSLSLWHHIETIPMSLSFATKRSTKF